MITLGTTSGSTAKDLFDLIRMKCRNLKIYRKGLKQGDVFFVGDKDFHVIWPPKEIDCEDILAKRIKEINEIIQHNNNLKKVFDEFDRKPEEVFCDEPLEYNNEYYEKERNIEIPQDEETKEAIKRLSKEMHCITNSFSICLYRKDNFLFLGDLEKKDINNCITYLETAYKIKPIKIKNFITPHHGIHWDNSLFDVHSWRTISSIGTNMGMLKSYIANIEKYKCISFERYYSTLQNGMLILEM